MTRVLFVALLVIFCALSVCAQETNSTEPTSGWMVQYTNEQKLCVAAPMNQCFACTQSSVTAARYYYVSCDNEPSYGNSPCTVTSYSTSDKCQSNTGGLTIVQSAYGICYEYSTSCVFSAHNNATIGSEIVYIWVIMAITALVFSACGGAIVLAVICFVIYRYKKQQTERSALLNTTY